MAAKPVSAAIVLVSDFIRCDLTKQASAMAYVTLLSLVPSLVAIFCILSLFAPMLGKGGTLVTQVREFVLSNLAAESGGQVVAYLDRMLASLDLKKIGWSSFASVLVTLVLLLRQIEEALNRIWMVRKGRNIFTRFMYFWTFLTMGTVVVGIIVGVTSGQKMKQVLNLQQPLTMATGSGVGEWLTSWGGAFCFFFFLYKLVPNCLVRAKAAAIGAVASATMLNVGGSLYGLFVRDSKNYQTLYGAMAQLPIFLVWLYVCWTVILLGALFAWRLQEGFPVDEKEDTLDEAQTPIESLRNSQVKSLLPTICLAAIYRNFQQATGRGISADELGHALHLPGTWVGEALDVLEGLGYAVMSKNEGDTVDTYYPAFPPESLSLGRISVDLGRPLRDWLAHWHHDLPLDITRLLDLLADHSHRQTNLAKVLGDASEGSKPAVRA